MPFDVQGRPSQELIGARNGSINMLLSGGGSSVPLGPLGDYVVNFDFTITGCLVYCTEPDSGGNIVVDLEATTYSAFGPTAHPAIADSICGGNRPSLVLAQKSTNSLVGWTLSFAAGTVIRVNVLSADVQAATVVLLIQRTSV